MVCCLPVLFVIPGITQYPLTVAGGILAAVALLHCPGDTTNEGYPSTTQQEIRQQNSSNSASLFLRNHDEDRDRARPCSC